MEKGRAEDPVSAQVLQAETSAPAPLAQFSEEGCGLFSGASPAPSLECPLQARGSSPPRPAPCRTVDRADRPGRYVLSCVRSAASPGPEVSVTSLGDPAGAIWWPSLQHASSSHYLALQATRSQKMGPEREPRAAQLRSPWKRPSCVLPSSSQSSWGRKRASGILPI